MLGRHGTDKKLFALMSPKSPIAESLRVLRTNIHYWLKDSSHKVILFTSASFESGKSVITANLGVVMAQAGQRVLIIDADLRNPQMYRFFSSDNSRGLTNILMENPKTDEIVRKTFVDGLSHIPSGPIPSNPAELLYTQKMRELLEKMKAQYDTVILDAPPVIGVTDVSLLAPLVDGIILVVKAGATTIDLVKNARAQLEKSNSKLLGIVLNEVKVNKKELKYYYYLEQRKAIKNSVVITPHLHQPLDRSLAENMIQA